MEVSNLFVCIMGMGVTFIGLIALIFLTMITGGIVRKIAKPEPKKETAPLPAPAADMIPNRGAMIAAVSAVIAEELGTDVSAIRILSFKKAS